MADQAYPQGGTHLAGANFVLFGHEDHHQPGSGYCQRPAILAIALVIMMAFLRLPCRCCWCSPSSLGLGQSGRALSAGTRSIIGHLVISTVQLGATVDYGILMAQHYIDHRQLLNRKEGHENSADRRRFHYSAGPDWRRPASPRVLFQAFQLSGTGECPGQGALTSLLTSFKLPICSDSLTASSKDDMETGHDLDRFSTRATKKRGQEENSGNSLLLRGRP